MKVIIAGSRDLFPSVGEINNYLKITSLPSHSITEIVTGCADGVDTCGELFAKYYELPLKKFPADWTSGRAAGPMRNKQMAEYADAALIIKKKDSKGSADMIKQMLKLEKPLWVFTEQ